MRDPGSPASEMARGAAHWLDSLSQPQLVRALAPAPSPDRDSDSERRKWFYTPTDHGGLTLGEQKPRQRQLVMRLLASALSLEGYVAVSTIMGLENTLDLYEDYKLSWGFERGRDSERYYLRIFGDPRTDAMWSWRFGGHHLSVNFVIHEDTVVSNTPFFMGADPASSPLPGGGRLSPLGGIERLARAFASTLDAKQFATMQLLDRAVSDIVTGNRTAIRDGQEMMLTRDLFRGPLHDKNLRRIADEIYREGEVQSEFNAGDHRTMAFTSEPKGLPVLSLNRNQRDSLSAVIDAATIGPQRVTYGGARSNDGLTPETSIAWGGDREAGPLYFRIQAGTLLYEYDNTQRKGNHVHSVLRDIARDFGADTLRRHYATHPH